MPGTGNRKRRDPIWLSYRDLSAFYLAGKELAPSFCTLTLQFIYSKGVSSDARALSQYIDSLLNSLIRNKLEAIMPIRIAGFSEYPGNHQSSARVCGCVKLEA